MARGRNQNRGRNQELKITQPTTQQQNQQQQQLAPKPKFHQTEQHPQLTLNHQQPMQSASATHAPVATINKHSNSESDCGNTSNASYNLVNNTTPSTNFESYGHNNKKKSNKNNNNYNGNDDANSKINVRLGEEVAIKTHLETGGDPAANTSATHTYQMTMSNNSQTNFRQVKLNDDDNEDNSDDNDNEEQHHQQYHHQPHHNDYSNSANNEKSCQQLPSQQSISYGSSLQQREESNQPQQLSNGENFYINRSPVIEQNVSVNAQVTDNNVESSGILTATSHNGYTKNDRLSNDQTECDHVLIFEQVNPITTMGQKNTKGDVVSSSTPSSPSSIRTRAFRESSIPLANDVNAAGNASVRVQSPSISVPTITVVDCSANAAGNTGNCLAAKSHDSQHNDKEEFYDFEHEQHEQREFNDQQQQQQQQEEHKEYDNFSIKVEGQNNGGAVPKANSSSYRSPSPTSMYSQMRYNYNKLEDVPEQEEEEYEEDDDEDDDEEEDDDDDEDEDDEEIAEAATLSRSRASIAVNLQQTTKYGTPGKGNLDNEFQRKHSASRSPDRQRAQSIDISKSNNSTASNLSTSFPDSGMGESYASTNNSKFINTNDTDYFASSSNMHHIRHQQQQREQFAPFVRDGSSTDCDETLMQCEELFDFVGTAEYLDPSERLVCIESISLPDVVVESTNSCGNASNGGVVAMGSSNSQLDQAASGGELDIININGATGNSMGSIHFIPIHVEGSGSGRSSPRKQSVDDSLVGSGKSTIEIIEDVTEFQQFNTAANAKTADLLAEKLKKELSEQKTQFSGQLEDAHKNVNILHTKINDMQMKIETLEQELSAKTWNVERLQGELNAAQRDDEYVRKKLKLVEDEKTSLRHRYSECEDELKLKYDELETQYNELQENYKTTQTLASSLHTQLAKAQTEAEEWREEVEKIRKELEEQIALLKSALENSENERKICEDKWQREFEMLRTHNMDREESIMTDCEWQLRQTQKQCKERIEKVEFARKEAVDNVDLLETELETLCKEIDDLKIYQSQVTSLRSVVSDQAQSIQTLMEQIETLKQELSTANKNLEEQIEAVAKIKYNCDNALYDKERQVIYRIDEVRNEAAAFWEDKLYSEMTRLKNELESVYIDERREALDKLQAEHVEELKVLTNRYTDNEDELRTELSEVQERLESKSEEFLELRERSDNALLQTRMHLDRADREYQKAMCQEEERKEALELSLRKEFDEEKQEMEQKFRERLGQVKEEFAKELQINTYELTEEHKKDLKKLRAKLIAEKEQALQELSERHRKKLSDVEERIKEIETRHKHDMKDLKAAYDAEKVALDKRDISNANEIEQLHRKCRCLTNLFEEMRMRYERRDPRPEDLREIAELRERSESQERDMYLLTDRLREMQNELNELQQNGTNAKKTKQIKKPPPKSIPTNCDVIYEENEERESPPPSTPTSDMTNNYEGTNITDDSKKQKIVADISKSKSKLITENQDDSHMITAM